MSLNDGEGEITFNSFFLVPYYLIACTMKTIKLFGIILIGLSAMVIIAIAYFRIIELSPDWFPKKANWDNIFAGLGALFLVWV